MKTICSYRRVLLLSIICVGCLAGTAIFAAPSAKELQDLATRAYKRHNYKQAIEYVDSLLKTEPKGDTLRSAQRVKAMAMCMYKRVSGVKYAKEIMSQYEPFKTDAALWHTIGYDGERRYDRRIAYEGYFKAATLYESAKKLDASADAWLQAARMLASHYGIQPREMLAIEQRAAIPDKLVDWPGDWSTRQKINLQAVLKICEHIAEMKVDDARKSAALFFGASKACQQGQWDRVQWGIAMYRRCVKEFPKQPQAPNAQYETGRAFHRFSKFVQAIKEYQLVFQNFPKSDMVKAAHSRIAEIKNPHLNLFIQKAYGPNEKPQIFWRTRNIKTVHLEARPVDLVKAVEKTSRPQHMLSGIIAQSKASEIAAAWKFETPDEAKHIARQNAPNQKKQTTLPIDFPLKKLGAFLVTATGANPDGKKATSHCLVVISKIAAVAKTDADQTVMFVADSSSGASIGDARAAVARYWGRNHVTDHASGKTNDAGLINLDSLPKRNYCSWIAAVRKGENQAICTAGNYSWSWWGYSHGYKVYGFTERPVYRPGQTVHFKQTIRKNNNGKYTNMPNTKVSVLVRDTKGVTIYSKDHVTDEFGSVGGEFKLKEEPPLGVYTIQVNIAGSSYPHYYCPGNKFRVEEYKKPEFKVNVTAAKPDYRVGDEMKIKIAAKYYYGQPVAGAEVKYEIRKQDYHHRYQWHRPWRWYYDSVFHGFGGPYRYGHYRGYHRPWGYPRFNEAVTSGTVKTDARGEAFVVVKAAPFKGHEALDLKFLVATTVTDSSRRVIKGSGEVKVTHSPFFIYPKPALAVYGPGDSVEINIKTENPNKQPVAGKFNVQAWRIRRIRKADGKFEEKLDQKLYDKPVEVGATGRAALRFIPDVTGHIKVIVRQIVKDDKTKPVEGSCTLWIASKTGAEAHYAYNALQIVPSKDQYEVDETLKVLINTNKPNTRVLLTGEADGLIFHKVIYVKKNSKLVSIPIKDVHSPNFFLTATQIRDNKVLSDVKKVIVPPTHRFLKVEVTADKGSLGGGKDNTYQPREKTTLNVKITDMHTKKPISGQVALMLVDSSVYYIQSEFRQAIEKDFYGFSRHQRVSTTSSYHGPGYLTPWRHHYGYGSRYRNSMPGSPVLDMAEAAAPMKSVARGGRKMDAKKNKDSGGQPKLADTIVRSKFRDTVLWTGMVTTDADGKAKVSVSMPDQLTTFALHAIAIDKETRVGQARADIITAKRIICRLESGRFFTEGDHSYVTVIAHNYFKQAQDLTVDLAVKGGLKLRKAKIDGKWIDYSSGQGLKVKVPASGEVRIDFRTTAQTPGDVVMTARARGVRESDAIQLTKPIVPWGAGKIVSNAGTLRGKKPKAGSTQTTQFVVNVPKAIKDGSQSLTVTLNPSIAAVAMDSLPYLAAYPYGCVEQTMSRFLPLVVMRKTVQDAGVSLDDIRKFIDAESAKDAKLAARYKFIRQRMGRSPVYSDTEVQKMIAAGIKRLKSFQHSDGSWGWWRNDSGNGYMTAYVLYGLSTAQACDIKIDQRMIDRGVAYLIGQASKPKLKPGKGYWWYRHLNNDNSRMYSMFVISRIKPTALKQKALVEHLDRIWEGRDELSDYGRSYLAMTLHAAGRKKDAKIVIENFDNTATFNAKHNDAHWGRESGWWYWWHGADESTSWVLQAMLTIDPKNKYVPLAVNYLVRSRRGLYWRNTKSTAMAVLALARYAKQAGELDCDQTYVITVDGQISRTVRVTKKNLFTFDDRIVLDAEALAPGKHTVKITRKGKGSLYWGAHLKYIDTAPRIKGGGNKMAIERKYFKLTREKFTNTRRIWKNGKHVTEKFPDTRYKKSPLKFGAEIASGELIEVQLNITTDHNFEYMMFEDPKPSGCEPHRLTSGGTYGGGVYANMELRDTRVVFFASWMPEGKRSISYKLRCEQPGTFRVLPTSGEAMYSPFIEAISDSGLITIIE
jgi:alpha-2-macroglobulin